MLCLQGRKNPHSAHAHAIGAYQCTMACQVDVERSPRIVKRGRAPAVSLASNYLRYARDFPSCFGKQGIDRCPRFFFAGQGPPLLGTDLRDDSTRDWWNVTGVAHWLPMVVSYRGVGVQSRHRTPWGRPMGPRFREDDKLGNLRVAGIPVPVRVPSAAS